MILHQNELQFRPPLSVSAAVVGASCERRRCPGQFGGHPRGMGQSQSVSHKSVPAIGCLKRPVLLCPIGVAGDVAIVKSIYSNPRKWHPSSAQ